MWKFENNWFLLRVKQKDEKNYEKQGRVFISEVTWNQLFGCLLNESLKIYQYTIKITIFVHTFSLLFWGLHFLIMKMSWKYLVIPDLVSLFFTFLFYFYLPFLISFKVFSKVIEQVFIVLFQSLLASLTLLSVLLQHFIAFVSIES